MNLIRKQQNLLTFVFDNFFRDTWDIMPAINNNHPATNIKESDKDFIIEFAIPGIGINESRDALSDGDFIIDYRYSRQVTENSKVSFIINNILNTEYQSRPANMMPPRTVSVQWSIKV